MIRLQLKGILVEVHWSAFLMLVLLTVIGDGFFGVCLFFFAILHEVAHGLASTAFHYQPSAVSIGLFGGVLQLIDREMKPIHGICIHSAGPLCNLTIALIGFLLYKRAGEPFIWDIMASNLILALFNLMPVLPLDGGKILELYVSIFVGLYRANQMMQIFSTGMTVLLFIFGLYMLQYNLLNLLICLLALHLLGAARADTTYSYSRVSYIYRRIKKENHLWD